MMTPSGPADAHNQPDVFVPIVTDLSPKDAHVGPSKLPPATTSDLHSSNMPSDTSTSAANSERYRTILPRPPPSIDGESAAATATAATAHPPLMHSERYRPILPAAAPVPGAVPHVAPRNGDLPSSSGSHPAPEPAADHPVLPNGGDDAEAAQDTESHERNRDAAGRLSAEPGAGGTESCPDGGEDSASHGRDPSGRFALGAFRRGRGAFRGRGRGRKVAKLARVEPSASVSPAQPHASLQKSTSRATDETAEEFDGITVRRWGRVVWNRPGFHDEHHIYPAGYRCEFELPGPNTPSERTAWVFEIMDVGDFNPMFKAMPKNEPQLVELYASPVQLWSRIQGQPEALLSQAGVPRSDRDKLARLGGFLFGLKHPQIRARLKALPDVDRCLRFNDSEASSSSGSSEELDERRPKRPRASPAPPPAPQPSSSAPEAPPGVPPLRSHPTAMRVDLRTLRSYAAAVSARASQAKGEPAGKRTVETQTLAVWPWALAPPAVRISPPSDDGPLVSPPPCRVIQLRPLGPRPSPSQVPRVGVPVPHTLHELVRTASRFFGCEIAEIWDAQYNTVESCEEIEQATGLVYYAVTPDDLAAA